MRLYMHNKAIGEGKKEASPRSKEKIKGFVDFYHINMDDFEPSDIDAYDNFEDFFVRAHKPGSRPIHRKDDPSGAVVVADSRAVVYETVAESKKLWIKGSDFSITNLVMDKQLGPKFADGSVASFRLSPQDYHRYHSPVTGTIKCFRSMPGDYYDVDPWALRSDVDILTRNARDYVVIDSEEFGEVLFVAIGAVEVGTVKIHDEWQKPGSKITKGDELGIFQFGGSSIIVAFQKGRIQFDEDLLSVSRRAIAMDVEVGMSLGRAVGRES
ncbi:phosphatidylserine decarboxylase [Coniosporium apollinis CBS 100218]|uniref:phosphatidylserine decarboxylase n=1 Tax=Coniosporium apollinis (strain CBS 100218) TaxID=1168221 RepID=R7YLI8_CONA1|nr:phosphatidylserine decarboxylase [Coniosporium apollinis CBS 100218]EON62738.1 phosphatidylserine decarboxylase [Coniosporium apollinis CBS 100218]